MHASLRLLARGALALAFGAPLVSRAYFSEGAAWPSGDIALNLSLQLSPAPAIAGALSDGTTSWNDVAQSVAADWNAVLGRSRIVATSNATRTPADGDGVTSVFFSTTTYGQRFGAGVLAVTLVEADGVKMTETDLIVNAGRTWDSYRGNLRSAVDLRRVLLHEFGHVLGLDHPDDHGQSVAAIMNSTISNLETLQTDDRNGANALYGHALVRPAITAQPLNQTARVGDSVTLTAGVNGAQPAPPADDLTLYTWYFSAPGSTTFEPLFTVTDPELVLGSVQLTDAGRYYFEVQTPDSTATSDTITVNVNPVTTSSGTMLANLSTRGVAGTGSRSMIVGFVVSGTRAKTVLLRGVGPTLGAAPFSVAGTLGDPQLTLRAQDGTTVATSATIWDQSANVADIRATTSRVGAFPLAAGSRDAVVLATLAPGNYTAQAASPTGATGVVLIEAYDADVAPDPTSRLANLSSRGFVGTDANILIAGFAVRGPGPHTYLIRVAGDTLARAPFNLTGTLDDPILRLFQGSSQLRENDDWDSPLAVQPTLKSAFQSVGAFTFTDRQESAMLVTLPPGNYTAEAVGNANRGSTDPTGIALIEIYEITN